jgi:Tfp pilus assembly protein PilO
MGKYLNKILLHRWEAAGIVFCILLATVCWRVCFPFAADLKKDLSMVSRDFSIMNSADSLKAMVKATRKKATMLDSTIKTLKYSEPYTEGTLPGVIYELAQKAGVKASRVEISVATEADEARQLPVRFSGSGGYVECGKFIDGVESLKPAAHIRGLSLKSIGKENVGLYMDFSVISPVR